MTDLSQPSPNLTLAPRAERAPLIAAPAAGRAAGFVWPTPPFAAYPPAALNGPQACAIEGLNGKTVSGRLMLFMPEQQVANVQIPPARTTLPLQFAQFRSLVLTEPLAPAATRRSDPHADVLEHRSRSRFSLVFKAGGTLQGETLGHVDTEFGLFLFPPTGEDGRVTRLFVPSEALASREIGARVGELLVESRVATREQVEQAAQVQAELRTQKLGDILVLQRIVTPDQLVAAIAQQGKMPMVRIGEALIALGLINQSQLQQALEQQKTDRSVPIGELLIRLGCVSRADLQTALSRKMGYPMVDAGAFPAESEALRKLPYAVARRLGALPLLLRDSTLVVAMEDPSRRALIDEIEFATQCKVAPVLASASDMEAALAGAYARIGSEVAGGYGAPIDASGFDFEPADAGKLLENLEREGADRVKTESEKPIEQSDNSLVRLIHTMIIEAWNQGVSDIHIENYPGKDKLKIRFRKDGVLSPYLELPHTYRAAIIGRIKVMCDLDISERRKPQDGKINFNRFSAQHRFELRVATIPTNNGLEDVVMRLLTSARPVAVDKLGLSARHLGQLKTAMERPYGLVLCVGPTGSGKTTTLHSALSHINVPERKIWTAEDPIEITQHGLRQVQVNAKIDWTFAKALRAFLRADPDVIMVGEIRDGETARTAIEASLTGHLVLSTLHTNSAPETVTRLLDMGMDPFNFADALLLVAAQRLVRKLCLECRTARPLTEAECEELLDDHLFVQQASGTSPPRETVRSDWLGRFGKDGRLMHFESHGCTACMQTGFRGRHGIHELMPVSREIRRLIQTGGRAEELQAVALHEGMRTLRQDGIEKVLQGLTTIDEVRATSNV
jgi:type II secretory ATPase GspE/PulE/Tfp pilus assembly ATPase PilB-like protein